MQRFSSTLGLARSVAIAPRQSASYVTVSAAALAAKTNKKGPVKMKAQTNSFRKKKTDDEDSAEAGSGGAGRQNAEYYKSAVPVRVDNYLPASATAENVGKVLGFPSTIAAALKHTPYPTLLSEQFNLLSPPALVLRQATVQMVERVDLASKASSKESRLMLTGESGSGKSALLLQTTAHCLAAGWVVIYVPKASTWVNSSTAYNKAPGSSMFVQPSLASNLVKQIDAVNKSVLSKLVTSENVKVGQHEIAQGTTLTALLEYGIKYQFAAQDVMEVFMREIGNQKDVPTLIAVDEVNNLYKETEYLGQDGQALNPEQLRLPRLFLEYLSGAKSVSQGAVVAATTECFLAGKSLSLDTSLGVQTVSPYTKFPEAIHPWTKGFQRVDVPRYSKEEAKGVFDYYKKGDVFFDAPTETYFLNKYLSTSGNPRKFFTACAKGI